MNAPHSFTDFLLSETTPANGVQPGWPASENADLPEERLLERFAIEGKANILSESHFGIVNGKITTNVLYGNVLSFSSLYAPPFASSDFRLEGRVFGESVRAKDYSWLPFQVTRHGHLQGVEVSSTLTLIEGERALVLEVALQNTTAQSRRVPVSFEISGGLEFATNWDFLRPVGLKPCQVTEQAPLIIRENDTGAMVLGAEGLEWDAYCSFWQTSLELEAGEERDIHLVLAVGEKGTVEGVVRDLLSAPAAVALESRRRWAQHAADVLENLPRLECSDERLEKFYDRSALHFLLNRWEVPEFALNPYYSTGSINGGCVCSYLWDFSEGWEIFPVVDPAATKEHIKAFLSINLTKHFAFNPISGAGWGPWYYINQEKIVFLISYYVAITGDRAFLEEEVAGKSVIDWVIFHALFGDRMEEEANLIDYGAGNHHLELRREYRYDHYLPDLNARRYPTYLAAEALCRVAGRTGIDFRGRAEKLKQLIRKELWSESDQWWHHKDPRGGKDLRYTMQMFKLIGSEVFDQEESSLIARLNEKEFLSEFGFHSISKLDPAYDQVDIDNGGGGACCCFPPQIAERLYKAGYPEKADDLLRRILWWGDRLPYWSDSLVANAMDYRKDTPLQNAIGAVAGAQALLFGMFGLSVDLDGGLTINPAPPAFSPQIAFDGLVLRGRRLAVSAGHGRFTVTVDGKTWEGTIGQPLTISLLEKF